MKRCVVFCFLLALCVYATGQSLEEARELYKIGKFKKALPAFEKAYNEQPTDAAINQWYGVCLYETNSDLNKAEQCITFAATKSIPESYLYLGRIYARTYRFDAANDLFEKYAKLKKRDKQAMAILNKERETMEAIKNVALRTEDIQIIDSLIVDKDIFLAAYKISPTSGTISYFNDVFPGNETALGTVYTNEKATKMYYARPDSSGYSLYSQDKLLEGFGNEKKLSPNNFGLSGNLNYPFMMTDGVTIYFAAEDKDGLGGYDIYVTRYNMNNDTYLTPERLTMPFNSYFNDYMMVVDEYKGIGWFATDRFQPQGKVCIYTFIPNEQVALVDSDNENYLVGRAIISSIKDSWKPGADYSKERELALKEIRSQQEKAKDFEFVINDQYTYYLYSDFKNQEAKNMFLQLVGLKRELSNTDSQLEQLRDAYSAGKSTAKANEILNAEQKQMQLGKQIKELEVKTRNKEVQSLNR
ncbi:tetratricopeptide repeat protein [Dysgonomonas sp. 216]|uniref:tetratricopeptide repeat protein n=1 Tax=Dysgonomonas sp. 216 TaxID=2302934 RepID=UPI0013D765A8|nr:tetratricopeptide repeat protein [Dysgonomonas sp. 216]NDW19828.1 tetratricopeptide repeat protein [Dysgonomonas sp. 216]